jgi:hypothetical protein
MYEKNYEEMREKLIEKIHSVATPIDFKSLLAKGILKQVGKSYYFEDGKDIEDLPKEARDKVNTIAEGRYGIKVTFYKDSKAMKNLAKKYPK